MRVDALIFDLDGTLWDSNAVCAAAWNRVLARLGVAFREITAADLRAVAGLSHIDAVRRVLGRMPQEQIAIISEETQREDNIALAAAGGTLFAGVREEVPRLAGRWPLMIVSNCQRGYVEVFLETSGLAAHFADFECWGNTGRSKGENLAAVIARNRLRSPLFVGDTEGDRRAASENGVSFVHAGYGFGEVEGCEHRLERFGDLPRLLAAIG